MFIRSVPPSYSECFTLFARILPPGLSNGDLLCATEQRPTLLSSLSSVQQEASSSPKLTTGAIVAIAVGVAMFFIVVAVLVFLVIRRRRRQSRNYAIMPEPGLTLDPSPSRTKNMHGAHYSPFNANATGGIAALRPVLLLGSSMTGIPL